jgi:hypothetical protein
VWGECGPPAKRLRSREQRRRYGDSLRWAPEAAAPTRQQSLVTPEGFEPPTLGSEDQCSIQLSYGAASKRLTAIGLGKKLGEDGGPGAIRTPDPFVRSEVLYPTELRAPKRILLQRSKEMRARLMRGDSLVVHASPSAASCLGVTSDEDWGAVTSMRARSFGRKRHQDDFV